MKEHLVILIVILLGLGPGHPHLFSDRSRRGTPHPHTFLKTPELIRAHGYPAEVHHVTSPDGYILELHRIPCGRGRSCTKNGSRVIFLQHGLLTSSADFVLNTPDQALSFLLADHGYDVWLGNYRGNVYSRRHVHLSPEQSRFWDFSVDEIAIHDMPTMLSYVRNVTKTPTLDYVGHSMGSTVFFTMLNYYPHINNWIRAMVGLAPVAYMHNKRVSISAFSSVLGRKTSSHEVGKSTASISGTLAAFCSPGTFSFICNSLFHFIGGPFPEYIDRDYIPVIYGHIPAGTSSRVITHFFQIIAARQFQSFDYGRRQNREVYGKETPNTYSLRGIIVPVGIFYSEGDWVADPRDVLRTASELPNVVVNHRVPLKNFRHLDFLYAKNARSQVCNQVLNFLIGTSYT